MTIAGKFPTLQHPIRNAREAYRTNPETRGILARTLIDRAHRIWAQGFRDGFNWFMNHPEAHEQFVHHYLQAHPELLNNTPPPPMQVPPTTTPTE